MLLFFGVTGIAQETLQLQTGQTSPEASLDDVAWIAGHWQGEAFGGIAEEIWSKPLGDSMMFVFRLLNDDSVSFYEIGHIKAMNGTLLMQLKHFDDELTGWEEKEETVDFKLVKMEKEKVFFEGLTMVKTAPNKMNVYVLVEEDGDQQEITFHYSRQ